MKCRLPISDCRLIEAPPSSESPLTSLTKSQIANYKSQIPRQSAIGNRKSAVLVVVLLIAALSISGCKKKKPAIPPPQAQAPTIVQPVPQQIPPATEAPAQTQPEQPKTEPAQTQPKPKPRKNTSARSRKPAKPPEKPAEKTAPATATANAPRTVVPEGGTPQQQPPELTASISHDAAQHQRMTTNQLLDSTEFNLKSISRALNSDEQAIVSHIRSFEQQSRAATAEGDTERAYNLAMKAHLLSDELIKR